VVGAVSVTFTLYRIKTTPRTVTVGRASQRDALRLPRAVRSRRWRRRSGSRNDGSRRSARSWAISTIGSGAIVG
jgi:hypothetical protein